MYSQCQNPINSLHIYMKTLIVVSGGDSPGINTLLFHYALLARAYGDTLIGAVQGFAGVLAENIITIEPSLLLPFTGLGGTYLPTSRDPVLRDPIGQQQLAAVVAAHKIDNFILLGGDGTLRHIPPILEALDIPCIGIPTTIDNDVPGTDITIGFDSACNFAHHTIDGILATAHALPGRVFAVETLGGHTGLLALAVAAASGAHAVLVPEYAYDRQWLFERLSGVARHHRYALLIMSEGIAASRTLVDDFKNRFGLQIRDTRLGHGQRGCSPSHQDRLLAAQMAKTAFTALHDGAAVGTVVVHHGQCDVYPGNISQLAPRLPERSLYDDINGLIL